MTVDGEIQNRINIQLDIYAEFDKSGVTVSVFGEFDDWFVKIPYETVIEEMVQNCLCGDENLEREDAAWLLATADALAEYAQRLRERVNSLVASE